MGMAPLLANCMGYKPGYGPAVQQPTDI
ncbi:hypothetical protein HaLaN_32741, partial [Haematococcus lacustris]